MDALLPIKPEPLPRHALLLERRQPLLAPELGAHQIDGRRQVVRARRRDHGRARVQELGQRRRARQRQVQREVLGREDQPRQVGRGLADFGQVGQRAGGLDEGQEPDGRGRCG